MVLIKLFQRTKVSSPMFKRKGNEKRLWLGLKRECTFGDAGSMEPCSNKKCLLCSLVRSSVSREVAELGIMATSSLPRYILDFQAPDSLLTDLQSH